MVRLWGRCVGRLVSRELGERGQREKKVRMGLR